MPVESLAADVSAAVERRRDALVELVRELVRCRSENPKLLEDL